MPTLTLCASHALVLMFGIFNCLVCFFFFLTEREKYTIGSMSHLLAQPAHGYTPLPDFPLVATDPSVRVFRRYTFPTTQ